MSPRPGTTCRERTVVPSNRRRPTGGGSKAGWLRSTTRPRRGRPTNLLPLQSLERALPLQPFGRDIAIVHVAKKVGSTHVAFSFLIDFGSFDFGQPYTFRLVRNRFRKAK